MQYRMLFFVLILGMAGCQSRDNQPRPKKIDYKTLPAFSENGLNVVVEIPAGTNLKIEYQAEQAAFEPDQLDGQDRIIRFLPYPGNYGFIPSTLMDAERGGDGDALDVLVLGESQATGTVQEVLPIGVLRLRDSGEIDTKIIAVPIDEAARVIDVANFRDFLIGQDAARRIIEEWFLNYKGLGVVEMLGWEDERYAMEEVKKWSIK